MILVGPERAFLSEELMLIPEDTELPPDYVQEWEGLCLGSYRALRGYPLNNIYPDG